MAFKIQLGDVVQDTITGFKGAVLGRAQYLTGCNQALVCPQKLDKEGKRRDGEWFDEQRLEPTGKRVSLDNGETPGIDEALPSARR